MNNKYFISSIFMCLLLIDKNVFASENSNIPDNAVEFNEHYYKLYELNMSWEDAQEYFNNINGHLATITSPEENDFIFEYITSLGYQSAYFGATDKESEGTWVWVTGEEFLYNNWHNNEPNNEGRNENYAMFYYKYPDGTWNDGGFKTVNANISKTPYICEWDNVVEEKYIANNQDDEPNQKNENDYSITDNDSVIINNIDDYNNNNENYTNNQNEIDNVSDFDGTTTNLNNQNDNIALQDEEKSTNNNKYTIEININNFSILGGVSILGGISVIGFVFKRKSKKNNDTQ